MKKKIREYLEFPITKEDLISSYGGHEGSDGAIVVVLLLSS